MLKLGLQVVYMGTICTVCRPENNLNPTKTWIDNPERGYKHWADECNLKPITNNPEGIRFTLKDIKDAYEDGYYEGTGDDAWYRDHTTEPGSQLDSGASVHRPMNEFLLQVHEVTYE